MNRYGIDTSRRRITATMAAPALAEFGLPILVAHLFVFYFGIFANITPPVALASFAAAGLSGGNAMTTSLISVRLAIAGFMVPYLFAYEHALLMVDTSNVATNATEFPMAPIGTIITVAVIAIVGVIALSAAIEGYFKTHLNVVERIILGAAGLGMIIPETASTIIGSVVVILLVGLNYLKAKKENELTSANIS